MNASVTGGVSIMLHVVLLFNTSLSMTLLINNHSAVLFYGNG